MTADTGYLFNDFKKAHPKQFLNAGIAEANMIGMAAGLSLTGKNVYCYSMSTFLIVRALEQIRIDLCYHNLSVKLLGAGGGLSYGLEGLTHQALEDIALLRALPNMTIFCPGDPVELEAVAKESIDHKGPLYIRFPKDNQPQIHRTSLKIKIGQGIFITKGGRVAIIATGSMLYQAKLAADSLFKKGIKTTLISMPTIKPLDIGLIKRIIKYKAIIVVEEHNIIGGLGDAVGSALMDFGYKGVFKKIGLPDKYVVRVGDYQHLCQKYGLTSEAIMNQILKLNKKYGSGFDKIK